ncbi:MAG: DNA-protecting protein DprA [Ruminococcaceae bacterium]|nr:DNA-protecting protein DprA [Oscillospiraceae bacterium]
MSALTYWIWLSERKGLRPETREKLLDVFGDPQDIYFASEQELKALPLSRNELSSLLDKSMDEPRRILDSCIRLDVRIHTIRDVAYPNRLRNIYDPPLLLYVLGRLPAIDDMAAIAVVGTRKATPYGVKMGRRMGYELTKGGALVVSGLAEGVDSAAAQGAIRAGGSCIGVLGTGIDQVYPRFNQFLFEDVQSVGALVSEYPPGAPISKGSFPRRNRILSGLSCGVVVIEAPEKSGALITAARALEQGRDLFAVPGNVDSPNCEGSNALIKDCAKAVTSGADVLCEYIHLYEGVRLLSGVEARIPQEEEPEQDLEQNRKQERPEREEKQFFRFRSKKESKPQPQTKAVPVKTVLEGLSEQQLKLVAAMTKPSMHIDEIIENSGLSAADALSEMTMLEIEGVVRQESGKYFSLNVSES